MQSPASSRRLIGLCFLVFISFAGLSRAEGPFEWKPVDPVQLAQRAPVVEPDADAEVLSWDVRVHDELAAGWGQVVIDEYLRIKIFTERGQEAQRQADIEFRSKSHVSDVVARTIRTDGTIVDVKKDDIHERILIKKGGAKVKAKSFAFPSVEPGAIVEYKWRLVLSDQVSNFLPLPLQLKMPIQLLRYSIKPLALDWLPHTMQVQAFHATLGAWDKSRDGYRSMTIKNIPAYREEPQMPPEDQVRAWMLVYYSENPKQAPEKFWQEHGRKLHDYFRSSLTPDETVRAAAQRIIGDAATPAQKLERLYEFCRGEIKKLEDDATTLSAEEVEKAKAKNNRTPKETLARRVGTTRDVDLLFGALAAAADLDVRLGASVDRSRIFFDESVLTPYFLRDVVIGVRDGAAWRFFDPGSAYLPAGMLRWQNEGSKILIADARDPTFVQAPISAPDKSLTRRSGRFRLAADGTLEGDVRIEYTGHSAFVEKERYDALSVDERADTFVKQVREVLGAAEVSEVRIEDVTTPDKPIVFSYHVRVPGYAQRTGKRLLLSPAVFERNQSAVLPTTERRHPVYFHFPWSEEDSVSIEVPAGFELDHPEAPGAVTGGPTADYKARLRIRKQPYTLLYDRAFWFGGEGTLVFEKESYPTLKKFFDVVHSLDDYGVTLKQSEAP